MHNFMKHFVRESPGRWHCVEPAEIGLPEGRVQVAPGSIFVRGTRYMNIDVAQLLDEQFEKNAAPR